MNPAWQVGDLIRIIDDPMSFTVGDDLVGLTGMIIAYGDEIYTVLISGGTRTVRVLDFMMEKATVVDNRKEENLLSEGKITNCPTCGVDLKGQGSCASINCPCAPRITV